MKKLKESHRSRRESPPKDLSRAAKDWHRRLTTEFEIQDEAGLLLLETAMRAYDRAETARALLERDGVTIADRWGQTKPHPAAAIERDARSGLCQVDVAGTGFASDETASQTFGLGTGHLTPHPEGTCAQEAMVDGSKQVARPVRKRFCTSPCTDKKCCAWPTDLNRRICRSRCRVG